MSKEDILLGTLDLAYEKGLGRISMSQIGEKVGLKKSSLYSHFKSKDDIIDNMYIYFREKAKQKRGTEIFDYGTLVEGRFLKDVLMNAVKSYRVVNEDENLAKFYRMIESERVHDPKAAAISVEETEKMINATKNLFYAISAKGIVRFADPEIAALSFAMGIKSIIMMEQDAKLAHSYAADGLMNRYVDEFCKVYEKK